MLGIQYSGDLPSGIKAPHRVRSGSCGGLDLLLPSGLMVNAPLNEHFAKSSPFRLHWNADQGASISDERTGESVRIQIPPTPAYYQDKYCSSGKLMVKVGQICSDRLGVGLTNRCHFWSHKAERCQFCSIGLNADSGDEVRDKALDEIIEVADAAIADPILPARHVLLGGGTPSTSDAGARRIAEAAERIKQKHPDVPIYAMIVPPDDRSWIRRLRQAGVDELGMNVEVFSEAAGARFMPGKHKAIGLTGYLAALETAVDLFGPVNTRSIILAGLEPADETVAGVARLAAMGVMPILTPFRPLVGTPLEFYERWSVTRMWDLTVACTDAIKHYKVPMGPTCIPCQSNTMTASTHDLHRYY